MVANRHGVVWIDHWRGTCWRHQPNFDPGLMAWPTSELDNRHGSSSSKYWHRVLSCQCLCKKRTLIKTVELIWPPLSLPSVMISAFRCGLEGSGFESSQSNVVFFNTGWRLWSTVAPVGKSESHSRASFSSLIRTV